MTSSYTHGPVGIHLQSNVAIRRKIRWPAFLHLRFY